MKPPALPRRLLAVPVLGERGGGIGQVSTLLWDAMRDEWPGGVDLVTLLRDGHSRPHAVDKVRFGMAVAGRQLIERPHSVVFSHLGLARIERYIPAARQSPYAVFLHGIEVWQPLGPRARAVLDGAALRIANSQFTARMAEAANPGIGEIAICPLALPKHHLPIQAFERSRDSVPIVLAVGRLAATEQYKGHEQLLRAWPGVVARVPTARLVIAGEGDDRSRLERLSDSIGIASSVRFTGFLSRADLDREYARAALFALPSRGEGFGLVYLEAMAHGLACVGSPYDAAAEVLVNGETGALVDPDDVVGLGRTVADLLLSPDRRRALGDAGRKLVDRRFRYENFRARVATLLSGVCAEKVATT